MRTRLLKRLWRRLQFTRATVHCLFWDHDPRDTVPGCMTCALRDYNERHRIGADGFPQEIVEPQPKPWWKTLWAYVMNREP